MLWGISKCGIIPNVLYHVGFNIRLHLFYDNILQNKIKKNCKYVPRMFLGNAGNGRE